MNLNDLRMVLEWARDEGWNPGIEDASAFIAADPKGFFLAEVKGDIVAAISVVNHDANNAFLGLFICRPEFRGLGFGKALWDEAMLHAGGRSVMLEGVPEQQGKYAKSGFVSIGKTVRYCGVIPGGDVGGPTLSDEGIDRLIKVDEFSNGYPRAAYLSQWFKPTPSRKTILLGTDPDRVAYATFRKCAEGVKVGPFQAFDRDQATALLRSRPFVSGSEITFIDIPEKSKALTDLVVEMGFKPVFETAKMVKGSPAMTQFPPYSAVASLELG